MIIKEISFSTASVQVIDSNGPELAQPLDIQNQNAALHENSFFEKPSLAVHLYLH